MTADLSSLEYAPIRPDEIEPVNGMLEQALTFVPGSMAPWTSSIGHEHMRVVRRDGRAVAGMSAIPFGHYIGGRIVPAGGITAVGVAPEQRGSGVGLFMIRQSLLELQRQGLPIATLYPATTAFYRRAGFERAALRAVYELPIRTLGVRDYTLEATPASPDDYATIKQLYAQRAAQSSGFIDRPDFYWNNVFEPKEKRAYPFVIKRNGVPEGYLVFLHASHGDVLQVRDYVALTPEAGLRILTLLGDHRSMLEKVRLLGSPNDILLFLLPEQNASVHWSLDLMLRILDVAGALSTRGYAPNVEAELHLDVQDDLLANNRGRFVLRVADGVGTVRPGGSGELRTNERGLASMYTGYLTPQQLQSVGMLEGSPAALAVAGTIFAGPQPWLPDMF